MTSHCDLKRGLLPRRQLGISSASEMILICNSLDVRFFQFALSLAMICMGGLALRRSMKGRIGIRILGVSARGNNANLLVGIIATILILLGIFVVLAALLGLDC